jgi:hypothetical protein
MQLWTGSGVVLFHGTDWQEGLLFSARATNFAGKVKLRNQVNSVAAVSSLVKK